LDYRERIPTKAEIQILRQLLDDKTALCAQLRDQGGGDTPEESKSQELTTLERELSSIKGALHPIRRCPADVLQMVFEWAILLHAIADNRLKEVSAIDWFDAATYLSHVCRRWRAIAIDTPMLWSRTPISLIDTKENLSLFWERTLTRVKGYPLFLSITGFGEFGNEQETEEIYATCRFHEFPNIDQLEFTLHAKDSLRHLLYPSLRMPTTKIRQIVILAEPDVDAKLDEFEFSRLLRRFPLLEEIVLVGVTVIFSDIDTFPDLRTLEFVAAEPFHMEYLPTQFPGLQRLNLRAVSEDISIECGSIHLPSLRELSITNTTYFEEFLEKLYCPNLVGFRCAMSLTDGVTEFMARHPTLRKIWLFEPNLDGLANVAPEVTTLIIDGDPSALLEGDQADMSPPILKQLRYFALLDPDNEMTVDKFEDMVTRRALAHEHPQSKLHPECQPLDVLAIGVRSPKFSEATWTNSPLYQSAVSIKFEKDENYSDLVYVGMSW
jgi:hypothetical protein